MMRVWSHAKCAWVKWQGSRTAWFHLPHLAVVAGTCILAGVALPHVFPPGPSDRTAVVAPQVPASSVIGVPEQVVLPALDVPLLPSSTDITTITPPATLLFISPPAPQPVPEPSSLVLFATGITALVLVCSLKKKTRRMNWTP